MDNECHANICVFGQNSPDPPPPPLYKEKMHKNYKKR